MDWFCFHERLESCSRKLGDVDESGNADETALSECWEIETVLQSTSGAEDVTMKRRIAWDSFFCRLRELTSLTRRSEEMLKYNVILSTSARVKILFSFAIMVNLSQYECLSEKILKTRTNIDGKCGYKQYKNSWILNWRIYCDEIEVGLLK